MWIQTVALGLNATVLVQVGSPLQMVAFAVWGHCQPPNQESICDDVGPGSCGYPDCPKPCYVDHTTGMVHMFCGQTHATQYKELQTSGTVHDTTHKRTVVTRHASRTGHLQNSDGPINFYSRDEPYYEFTNFYEHAISIDGKKWNTSEHYFQAQKFVGTPYMEIIRNMQRPRDAFDLSRDPFVSPWLRSDWETVKLDVMYKALLAKFSQHNNLKALLLRTGKRELIEHTSNDKFWGDGGDGCGQNNLGKLLMRVREVLKNSSVTPDGDDGEVGGSLSHMSDRDHSCKGGDIGTLLDFVEDIEQSDEEQPPCSLEQHTDGSDRNQAVGQNGENLMDEGSLTPAVIDHDKNSNGVETGQMPEIPLSVHSDVDKAEPMEVGGDQNKNSV
eukprot:Em0001g2146a